MTGDIANQNDEEGYKAFLELLEALGPLRPEPSHIVVTPGNHDVKSGLLAGDARRYERFVDYVRGSGFVTPILAGVDTSTPTGTAISKHILMVGGLQIVPIDSSAYAQVELDVGVSDAAWEAAVDAAQTIGGTQAAKSLRKLRIADAARVDEKQLEALRTMLAGPVGSRRPPVLRRDDAVAPMRIAVLHHQLLPVSVREEIKSFESLTNLGLLRQFLRDNGFALVLHGHKHAPHSYVDYVISYNDEGADTPAQIRVIAGPSPSGRDLNEKDICRLIDIDIAMATVTLESVPAVPAGQNARAGAKQTFLCMPPGATTVYRTDGITVFDGRTIGEVYSRLVPTLIEAVGDNELQNVICRMHDSPTDEAIAVLYPGFSTTSQEAAEDRTGYDEERLETQLSEFQELVRWWQDPEVRGIGDEPAFTHGNRILRYDGHLDQIASVVDTLRAKPETSRAVVVLLHPGADRISTLSRQFPSFCLVQFHLRRASGGKRPQLECTAYFRKQEVRYWWLVNVAELASLQRRVATELARTAKDELAWLARVVTGSVVTIAARAHVDPAPPKVQIPKVDQYYATARERLVDMAHALVWPEMPCREEAGQAWLRLMTDLIPASEWDSDGIPIARAGLHYLALQVRQHAPRDQPTNVSKLADALDALWSENESYAKDQQLEKVDADRHAAWRQVVKHHVATIIELAYISILERSSSEKVVIPPRLGTSAKLRQGSKTELGPNAGRSREKESSGRPLKAKATPDGTVVSKARKVVSGKGSTKRTRRNGPKGRSRKQR